MRQVMEANQEEIGDDEEAEWYIRRMDAGLSSLQNADYILAWMCMEDDGVSPASHTTRRAVWADWVCLGDVTRENPVGAERPVTRTRRRGPRRFGSCVHFQETSLTCAVQSFGRIWGTGLSLGKKAIRRKNHYRRWCSNS